jgi:hypothetical protein
MTNQQLFIGLLIIAIGLAVNGWVRYVLARSKEIRRQEIINQNIAETHRKIDAIKAELATLSNINTTVPSEERLALFAMSEAFAIWFAAIESFDYKLSDQLDENIATLESISQNFVAAHNRFSLLAFEDTDTMDALDDLIKVAYTYQRLMITKGNSYKNLELNEIPEFVYKMGFRRKESAEMVKEHLDNVNRRLRRRLGFGE